MNESLLGDVSNLLDAEPFVSFQVLLTSGTAYQVHSPFQLVPEGSKMNYYFFGSNRFAMFRINQIVAIETLQT